ncbi:MAG TPA: hypothetical protein VLG16_05040 [Candidatus Saccharimonadales bacterium]|nr:hypothetical protein [Candidatus Saccharimonadales bacterium]
MEHNQERLPITDTEESKSIPLTELFPSILTAWQLLEDINSSYQIVPPEYAVLQKEVLPAHTEADMPALEEPAMQQPEELEAPEEPEESNQPAIDLSRVDMSRGGVRSAIQKHGKLVSALTGTAVQYLASYDDPAEGLKSGKEIVGRISPVHLPFLKSSWLSAAQHVVSLRQLSQQLPQEIEAVRSRGDETSYQLIRNLAANPAAQSSEKGRQKPTSSDVDSGRVLNVMVQLSGSTLHRDLVAELEEGRYDSFIAQEMIDTAITTPDSSEDVVRITQLSKFVLACLGQATGLDNADIFRRMAGAAAEWPINERQILLECRRDLQARLLSNYNLDAADIKYFKSADRTTLGRELETNLAAVVMASVHAATKDLKLRTALMQVNVAVKKRRKAPQKANTGGSVEEAPVEEKAPKPRLIVSCDLKEGTMLEGADGLIEASANKHGGADDFQQDLKNSITYMARTDLRGNHKGGIKPLVNMRVKFNDKPYQLFEFKALEAAGLPTKTELAKQMRIYFIKMNSTDSENPYDTFGIIEIGHRSNQAEFLKTVRLRERRQK